MLTNPTQGPYRRGSAGLPAELFWNSYQGLLGLIRWLVLVIQLPPKSPRSARGGFTLLEILIAFTVLLVGFGGTMTLLFQLRGMQRLSLERTSAANAAASKIGELQATDFNTVFARYNESDLDDPGSGDSPGIHFEVPGLSPRGDDEDGFCGRILFPAAGPTLIELVDMPELSMPRDLNFDGITDDEDQSGSYDLLPVLVRVDWTGVQGDQSIDIYVTLH